MSALKKYNWMFVEKCHMVAKAAYDYYPPIPEQSLDQTFYLSRSQTDRPQGQVLFLDSFKWNSLMYWFEIHSTIEGHRRYKQADLNSFGPAITPRPLENVVYFISDALKGPIQPTIEVSSVYLHVGWNICGGLKWRTKRVFDWSASPAFY